jgi:membrane protein
MFNIHERLEHIFFDPPKGPRAHILAPVQRALRFAYALIRDFYRGDINLRAMSLVYTTLLSIVPLLAFSFSIFKSFGLYKKLEPLVYEFFSPVGDNASLLTARVMGFVANISSGVLGTLGLAFLLFTVVSTIQKVEGSFNYVWRVERPRSFARRVSEYLSLMVVGPVVIVATFGLGATVSGTSVVHSLEQFEPFSMLFSMMGRISPYFVVSGFFAFLYMFIPNTRVRFVPALIGGLAAGLLWVLVGAAFTRFFVYASNLQLVYTSFAFLITGLIWIYTAWLILLLGAQLSFYIQNPQYLRRGQQQIRLTGALSEQLALNVMMLIGKSFRGGEPGWSTTRLAARLDIPSALLASVVRALECANLLVATEDERLLPARDLSEIELSQIVDAARRHHRGEPTVHVRGTPEAERVMTDIELALHGRLEGRTLREAVMASEQQNQPRAIPVKTSLPA